MIAGRRGLNHITDELSKLLSSENLNIRAASAAAILQMESGPKDQAETHLKKMLDSDDGYTFSPTSAPHCFFHAEQVE